MPGGVLALLSQRRLTADRSTGLSVRLPVHVEELTPAALRKAQQDTGHDVLVEFYGKG